MFEIRKSEEDLIVKIPRWAYYAVAFSPILSVSVIVWKLTNG